MRERLPEAAQHPPLSTLPPANSAVRSAADRPDLDRRSAGAGGVPRVHIDIEVHVHRITVSMCAGRSYVYLCPRWSCITAARTAVPFWRVRSWRERPCVRKASHGTARVGMCTSIPPLAWGRSRSINPGREGKQRGGTNAPVFAGDAGQPGGQSVRRTGPPPHRCGARHPSWKDYWPGATSRGGRHGRVHADPPRWLATRPRRGVAPATAAPSCGPRPLVRPRLNRNPPSEMRNRRPVRATRDSVSTHPRCRADTRSTAPGLRTQGDQDRPPRSRRNRHAVKPSIAASEGAAGRSTSCPESCPRPSNPATAFGPIRTPRNPKSPILRDPAARRLPKKPTNP